ncbi:MAG TPA: biliverdin-producing heme oxygenase [Candidatus Corynebacterium gallistercoris]|uniref:heme oxygenase (biliverdin-producing) n=1 Tax=Candidatus Corynebacterium gallistercoris TaxID=2838530 RepID=A0A9D1UPN2_9CORY|nr:biliverdin-producing heme oxygenase [Candidatus Corynebacterium gallistercoris]
MKKLENVDNINSLSRRLKEETAAAHERAEHSTFIVDLMSGALDVPAFIALQQQALVFYAAIEKAVEALQTDPRVAKIADRRLDRVPALKADLAALGAENDVAAIEALPATAAYVAALEEIMAEGDAAGLIAHHYVRYLGDLSGGQIIARKMTQLYGLEPEALGFYAFPELGKLKPYKDQYRETLDTLQKFLTEDEQDDMVTVAGEAFLHNMAVFADLGQVHHVPEAPNYAPHRGA